MSDIRPGGKKPQGSPSQLTSIERRRAVVVRPYSTRIRDQAFQLLERAGVDIAEEDVLAPESTDDQVLHFLSQHFPQVLLVPFHAQRSGDGDMVDGLSTLRKVEKRLPRYAKMPVLMPISNMGLAALNLMLGRDPKNTDARILILKEDDLEEPATIIRIRQHLARFSES